MVIVIIFLSLLVLGTQVVLCQFVFSDFHRPIWDKHSRKSTIFLRVIQIFRLKIAQIRNVCAQKVIFVQVFFEV